MKINLMSVMTGLGFVITLFLLFCFQVIHEDVQHGVSATGLSVFYGRTILNPVFWVLAVGLFLGGMYVARFM